MKKFNCINDNLSHKDIEGIGWNIALETREAAAFPHIPA